MRILCAAAVALSLGLFVACADDKKPDPKAAPGDRAARLAAMKKKFDTEMEDLKARFGKASPDDQRGILAEARELALITAQKALEIAKDDPKDEVGFEAAAFVIEKAGRFGKREEVEAAAGIVAEHHLSNPKVKDLLPAVAQAGPAGEKFLAAAAEKAADKEVKGVALFLLGAGAAARLEEEEDEKKAAELVAKAVGFFERAAKEAPDAKFGPDAPDRHDRLGKLAAKQIADLKAFTIVAVGKPAPDVESVTLEGKPVKLSDYKGKVVLLDMWATWCGPCRAMIPHSRELVKSLKDKPFVLVSVSADDEKEALEKFLEKEPMPWVHWWDNGPASPVLKKYRVRAFPTLYLIDHAGVVREKWVGIPGNDPKSTVVDDAVEKLLKEAEKAKG